MSPRIAGAVLCLAAAPLAAETGRAFDARPVASLVWYDPEGVAWGAELYARAEAEALLARMGAKASWRRGAAGETMRRGEVWLILVGAGPQRASAPLVLGATRTRHGVVPSLWVRVPNVCAAVGVSQGRPLRYLPPADVRDVGIALGRVIVHEVVHALVPSLGHGTGLMSENLGRRELTAASIAIESDVGPALQAALRGDPVLAPPGVAVLAAQSQVQDKDR